MEYEPERDIPKAVKELRSVSPTKIVEWIKEHRTERDALGRKQQLELTPQSVTMWFKRHPDISKQLERDTETTELEATAITQTLFENGNLEQVPCIDKWILQLRARGGSLKSGFLTAIKQVCLGELPKQKGQAREVLEGWGIKHPARLTLEDGMRYIAELQKRKLYTRRHRLALRNFLKSRNIEGVDEISGRLESDAGKYAHLKASKQQIAQIFEKLRAINYEVYLASLFAFHTACRVGAVTEAESKYINHETRTITVFEKASLHGAKRRMTKRLPEALYMELKDRKGKLFNISAHELNSILRSVYNEVLPDLVKDIQMPFHFWRHQFAQHMLDATGRNYGLVAKLGGWTVQVLEKYYGAMSDEEAFKEGVKYVESFSVLSSLPLEVNRK